jgi:hypothetical protein
MLKDQLEADTRNVVCTLKPVAYELQGTVRLLSRFSDIDTKGYTVESLWKYLLLTEIAISVAHKILERHPLSHSELEKGFVKYVQSDLGLLDADFSVRLERCVEDLLKWQESAETKQGIEGTRTAISETLHSNVIRNLRQKIREVLGEKRHIFILVDNLDKAWDRQSDIEQLAPLILGLLSITERLPDEFKNYDQGRPRVDLSVVIFLRSDIYSRVTSQAREPDKIRPFKLIWDNTDMLMRVIEERFLSSSVKKRSLDEIWNRYFCSTIRGEATRSYLSGQISSRPRDIVYICKAAIAHAVNSGHSLVMEEDIVSAEKEYSQYALESILVENGVSMQTLEEILWGFVGESATLSRSSVDQVLSEVGVETDQHEKVIDHLCILSFLGVEIGTGEFRFADDRVDFRVTKALAQKYRKKSKS